MFAYRATLVSLVDPANCLQGHGWYPYRRIEMADAATDDYILATSLALIRDINNGHYEKWDPQKTEPCVPTHALRILSNVTFNPLFYRRPIPLESAS